MLIFGSKPAPEVEETVEKPALIAVSREHRRVVLNLVGEFDHQQMVGLTKQMAAAASDVS